MVNIQSTTDVFSLRKQFCHLLNYFHWTSIENNHFANITLVIEKQ